MLIGLQNRTTGAILRTTLETLSPGQETNGAMDAQYDITISKVGSSVNPGISFAVASAP